MHNPKWALFFDFHTMPACPDVGENFDVNAFIEHLKACKVDYVVFPARCNLGMAYYNTKVGIRHPSLKYDLFGKISEACAKAGIAISAYINCGLSHEEALLHRDWAVLFPEGYTYKPNRLDHFFRQMCYNTPYGEHLLEMIREVVTQYPISGLFLDCFYTEPCIGVECIREMKKLGYDWKNPKQLAEYNHMKIIRMAKRIAETVNSLKPNMLLYFNGIPFEDQQNIGTYLEYECLPTGGWGYEALPVYARYARNLGKPILNMTGRFHRGWGDFGGIRTEASLEYDCLYGLANAMRTTIGDHFHPRGDINRAVFNLVRKIYSKLQKFEPWFEDAVALTDIALVAPKSTFQHPLMDEEQPRCMEAVRGATRMLCELKMQFDIITPKLNWKKYRLLVLPDLVLLDDEMTMKIKVHLNAGGQILASCWSGLDYRKERFILEDEWGVAFKGDDPYNPAYLLAYPPLTEGLPDMPMDFYSNGVEVEALPETKVLGEIIAPYYSRYWDGEHGYVYNPPAKKTGRPVVTRKEAVAYIARGIFTGYYHHASVPMRQLISNLLQMLLPDPLVRVQGLPSFARVTVTGQTHRRMVHILSYVPERRGSTIDMIEEPIELREVRVSLRLDGRMPKRVYLAPEHKELSFTIKNGYISTVIPLHYGYSMVVFEEV
ncbi:MAG: beta-galactosidase trimerization domain-containing protein [Candidatus Bathyarchaeia archaeon]